MANSDKGIGFRSESKSTPQGKNHLLVIAIDEYAHCPKLNNCVKDAREFIEVLTDKYQFEPEHVTTLYNGEATRANILGRLNELKQKVRSEDNLIIYFSGHGETEDDVGYWVPVAAQPEHNWEFISTYDIKSRLDPILSFHTFVIVDACFSGSLFAAYKSVKAGYETKRSRLGLAASHSRERALDGTAGENSPFAATLLKRLRESPEDLSVQRLATEVIEEVQGVTRGRQTPVFKPLDVKGDDSGQYVFHLKANEAADWKACQEAGTLAAYQAFQGKYPEGMYVQAAMAALMELAEESSWEEAKATNTILSYYQYNQRYVSGKYHAEALAAIERLEEEEAWQQAQQGSSLSAFLKYKEHYSQGRFAAEAEEKIQAILASQQEPAAWQAAKGKNTVAAYQAYLQQYPLGPHALEARSAIQELNRKAEEERERQEEQARKKKQEEVERQRREVEVTEQHRKQKTRQQELKQAKSVFPWKKWLPIAAGILTIVLVVWGISRWLSSPSIQTGTATLKGQTYKTVTINGKTWMAENLNYKVDESWCYGENPDNCDKYGRLYTLEGAKQACKEVGWRLPTDQEWRDMAILFGGADDDANGGGESAYQALIKEGNSGFSALLSGLRGANSSFGYLGDRGYYWSATKYGSDYAWLYVFYRFVGELDRFYGNKAVGVSCRCVQD